MLSSIKLLGAIDLSIITALTDGNHCMIFFDILLKDGGSLFFLASKFNSLSCC